MLLPSGMGKSPHFVEQKSKHPGKTRVYSGVLAFLCRDWGSDPGHHNFQSCALPTELSRQIVNCLMILTAYAGCVKESFFLNASPLLWVGDVVLHPNQRRSIRFITCVNQLQIIQTPGCLTISHRKAKMKKQRTPAVRFHPTCAQTSRSSREQVGGQVCHWINGKYWHWEECCPQDAGTQRRIWH